MLTINVSGWKKGYGPYSLNLPFNEQKQDYEIRFKDGICYVQESPFQTEAHDWNNDGDIYSQYGAWFREKGGRGEFFTPVDMLRLVQEDQAEIPGLSDPLAAIDGYLRAKEERGTGSEAGLLSAREVAELASSGKTQIEGSEIPPTRDKRSNEPKRTTKRPSDRER